MRLQPPVFSSLRAAKDQRSSLARRQDRSGVLEYPEFVWLLANLNAPPAAGNGSGSAHTIRYVKSVDELRADRLREAQQQAHD